MKLLMLAYSCRPDDGGEPSVGWNWAVAAVRDGHDVHLVTRENNRDAVEAGRSALPTEHARRLTVHYHDLGASLVAAKHRLPMFGVMTYYVLWQLAAVPLVRRVARANRVDLVHHVTFCNDAVFSAAAFAGVPFVWGPIGGWSHRFPRPYYPLLSPRSRLYEAVRRAMQGVFGVLDPLCWLTRRRATLTVFYSQEARSGALGHADPSAVVRHVGIAPAAFAPTPSVREAGEPLRLVAVGRLVHWKGFDLTLRALAAARDATDEPITLDIVGVGDEDEHLQRLGRRLGVADVVRFHGRLPDHSDVGRTIARSHLFVQPTLRDGPPVAMMEAMALGVPVLAAAFGAVPELVPATAGRVLPDAGSPDALVAALASELCALARDEPRRRRLAAGALEHARRELTWDAVAANQRRVYAMVEDLTRATSER